MTLYVGDRVRTVVAWGCFKDMRGVVAETKGTRVMVRLDGDKFPVLLFANEVVLDEPEPHVGGAE